MFAGKRLIIPILTILLAGCMQNDTQESEQENSNSQPIKYETEQEQNDGEQKKYPDDTYQNVNEGDQEGQSDKFTNELSMSIADSLKGRQAIRQAQVAAGDDKVVVGIMLNNNASPDIRDNVEQDVQEMVPKRDVQVYTDDSYWDRMRNKDAELDQLNGDMREYLQEFFRRDREHF
ncbi:hypothetical protein GCM10028778_08490 [Barrientosiimonas marina]|uniref:YhcN/YlaJ family sporulation lipoprotein n=1 Tax=Lentibacillus kimchii TaxID=1542911 RepID=A0ABW2UZK5_9BACI